MKPHWLVSSENEIHETRDMIMKGWGKQLAEGIMERHSSCLLYLVKAEMSFSVVHAVHTVPPVNLELTFN